MCYNPFYRGKKLTYMKINQDGSGPLKASIDPSSAATDRKAFKTAKIIVNVPGDGFIAYLCRPIPTSQSRSKYQTAWCVRAKSLSLTTFVMLDLTTKHLMVLWRCWLLHTKWGCAQESHCLSSKEAHGDGSFETVASKLRRFCLLPQNKQLPIW